MRRARSPQRIVVKVGTKVLTDRSWHLSAAVMGRLVRQIGALVQEGRQVVLVTSGAVVAGMAALGLKRRPTQLTDLQAAASIGQSILMHRYGRYFRRCGRLTAQVLLTRADIQERHRYLNLRHTFLALLGAGVVPIVNENDAVAVEEIKFGDNDRLSALVALLVDADLLVLLTDVEGLYDGRRLITRVRAITPAVERIARGAADANTGLGGMVTKLQAARIAGCFGIPTAIADGRRPRILTDLILDGHARGTYIEPATLRLATRKRWMVFASHRLRDATGVVR